MKKWKKLSLLSYLFFGLVSSLGLVFILSTRVSALQYDITNSPLWVPSSALSYPNYYQRTDGFTVTTSSEYTRDKFGFQPKVLALNKNGSHCEALSSHPIYTFPYEFSRSSDKVSFNFSYSGTFGLNLQSSLYCGNVTEFSSSTLNSDSISSLSSDERSWASSNFPYRQDHSVMNLIVKDVKNPDTGFVYNSYFDLMNLFKNKSFYDGCAYLSSEYAYGCSDRPQPPIPEYIYGFTLPIGRLKSNIDYHNNQHISFTGQFFISLNSTNTSFELNPTTTLETTFVSNDYSGNRSYTSQCNSIFNRSLPQDPQSDGNYLFSFTCDYDLPSTYVNSNSPYFNSSSEFPWFRLKFDFNYDSSESFYIFQFKSLTLTTDRNYDYVGVASEEDQSNHPEDAFGGAGYFGTDLTDYENANWLDSLINLFNFNILNPFAPMFALFTDGSACVSIPTIAGMLHSEETTYCPWFDSEVRNIVTPVVGLSSTMLLFGFIVRWLGSSSGNLTIDSPAEESSGGYSRTITPGVSAQQVHQPRQTYSSGGIRHNPRGMRAKAVMKRKGA